jgi:arylsulfatase
MTNFTETTWMGVLMTSEMEKIMKTYVDYPPRKLQSIGYTGPIKISDYQRLEWVRQQLATEGITLTMPTGN